MNDFHKSWPGGSDRDDNMCQQPPRILHHPQRPSTHTQSPPHTNPLQNVIFPKHHPACLCIKNNNNPERGWLDWFLRCGTTVTRPAIFVTRISFPATPPYVAAAALKGVRWTTTAPPRSPPDPPPRGHSPPDPHIIDGRQTLSAALPLPLELTARPRAMLCRYFFCSGVRRARDKVGKDSHIVYSC